MKKTIYGALGLAGACAACCAIPIAFPMFAGASLAGAAGWAAGNSILIAVAMAAAIGLAVFMRRRALQVRSGPRFEAAPAFPAGAASSCGCTGKSAREGASERACRPGPTATWPLNTGE